MFLFGLLRLFMFLSFSVGSTARPILILWPARRAQPTSRLMRLRRGRFFSGASWMRRMVTDVAEGPCGGGVAQ